MTQASYKSTRLLIEAVNREMDSVRKAAMGNMALGALNELRDLVGQLAKKAERPTLEEVQEMAPADYVAAMKPLVAKYHLQLMIAGQLAPCLCMDLRLAACVVILVGDESSIVRAAHDPERPDAALIVETIIASLDSGTKRVAQEAAELQEKSSLVYDGIDRQVGEPVQYETTPLTIETIEEGARITLSRGSIGVVVDEVGNVTPEQVEDVKRLPDVTFRAGYLVDDESDTE